MADRGLTAAMVAELAKGQVSPVVFVEAEFLTATVNFWSGVGEISWDSKTWTGTGELGSISPLSETTEISARPVSVSLSGIPTNLVDFCLNETRRGKPLSIWFGFLSSTGTVIADPDNSWSGRMDSAKISDDGETSTITITAESDLADLNRNEELRYTHQNQQAFFAGDDGFKYVESIQNLNLIWGRGTAVPLGSGSGGDTGPRDRGERLFTELPQR